MRLGLRGFRLRMWHLLGLVAASAAFFAIMQFRGEVEDPTRRELRRLRYGDVGERVEAAKRLASGPGDGRVIEALLVALHDRDGRVRAVAASVVSAIDREADHPRADAVKAELLGALQDQEERVRWSAAIGLAMFPKPPEGAIPVLIDAARRADEEDLRVRAVNMLGFFAQGDRAAREALFAALKDRSPTVRGMVASVLHFSLLVPSRAPQPFAGEVRRVLLAAAKDEDAMVRARAAYSLGMLGERNLGPLPEFPRMLDDPDAYVRQSVAQSLRWAGPGSRVAVPALIRALRDEKASVRQVAAMTLGALGPDAEPALPALREAAEDRDGPVRDAAGKAIAQIEPAARDFREDVLPGMIAGLADEDADLRRQAAVTLGDAGPKAGKAAPDLVRRLDDPDPRVRRVAAEALEKIGSEAGAAPGDSARRAAGDEPSDGP